MPGSLSPGSVPRGGLVLSTRGRCFSTDGHRCIEPSRYLLGAGRGCCWRRALLLAAVPLPACKAAFLKIPPAMSSAGARSGHGDVTAKERRMGASLGDQAGIIPASGGEIPAERGVRAGYLLPAQAPMCPHGPQPPRLSRSKWASPGIHSAPLSQTAWQCRERELAPGRQRASRVTPLLDPRRACSWCAGAAREPRCPCQKQASSWEGWVL